jgi:hypothetical protein
MVCYVYAYVCVCIYIYIYIYIYISICVYAYMWVCVCVYVWRRNYISKGKCRSIFNNEAVPVHMYTYISAHTRMGMNFSWGFSYWITAILIIIEGQLQDFQRFSYRKLLLKAVASCFAALNYYENGSICKSYIYVHTYTKHTHQRVILSTWSMCRNICMHVYMCIYTYTCVHTNTWHTYTLAKTYIHTYTDSLCGRM